jgi:hypothetical protein
MKLKSLFQSPRNETPASSHVSGFIVQKFVPNGNVSAPRNRLAVYKCPKGYLVTFYEKEIKFSNCTSMRSKRETVILKLNKYF